MGKSKCQCVVCKAEDRAARLEAHAEELLAFCKDIVDAKGIDERGLAELKQTVNWIENGDSN